MPNGATLLGFIAASLVVLLIPGPAVLFVVARSIGQGYRAGLIAVLGLSTGALVHVAAATAGLSAILLASATAFGVVKALGAVYLIYLGMTTLLSRRSTGESNTAPLASKHRVFTDGVLVSVFNPKLAVFFLAFLPQFVDPARGPVSQQILFLGFVYTSLALVTDSGYALAAGTLRDWLRGRVTRSPVPRYVSGTVYLGLGVTTALTGRQH
jgi:threonine/homoserine/homoserine lactone efflux protein